MSANLLRIFLALMSGFLLGISFPSSEIPAACWISLIPLLLALRDASPRRAFFLAWLTGFCFFSYIYQWGFIFGTHVFLALALWQGFYIGLWGVLACRFLGGSASPARRIFIPALLWVCYEYLKAQGPLGTNWGALAYSQYRCISIIQVAGISGIYGISFLIALVNSALAEVVHSVFMILRKERGAGALSRLKTLLLSKGTLRIALGITAAAYLLIISYGNYIIARDAARREKYARIRITIAQPDMDMCMKWDKNLLDWTLTNLEALTRRGIKEGGKLIFWPETSIPTFLSHNPQVRDRLLKFCFTEGAYLLGGAPSMGADGKNYNSVFLFSPYESILGIYSKRHLVPFGEYLPFEKHLRKYQLFDRVQNFSPGRQWTLFRSPWAQFAVLICFESDFPAIARANIRNGAQFLAVVTNDAWFERSAAARHHIGWDVFRAVENHSNIIQSANTGICAFIDFNGKIYRETPIFTRTEITDEIVLAPVGTFYTCCGDLFAYICLIFTLILILREPWGAFRTEKKTKKGRTKQRV